MNKRKLLTSLVAGLLLAGIFFLLGRPEKYDVLVVGAGAAGLFAALEAEAEGASVLVIEKMPTIGGNTIRATGGMNAAESEVQEKLGISDSLESSPGRYPSGGTQDQQSGSGGDPRGAGEGGGQPAPGPGG